MRSAATASMDVVLKVLTHSDGRRRVSIVRRTNGWFGFEEEEFSEDPLEMCWLPSAAESFAIFDAAETAEREARNRIEWLREREPE